MDGFKNPFDDHEAEQMINIAETTPQSQPSYPTVSKPQPKTKPQPNIKLQDPVMETSQDGLMDFSTDQTIFMSSRDAFASKGTQIQDEEPPLLEDIGIDLQLIFKKMLAVLKLEKPDLDYAEQSDLFGPVLIALVFGFLLMLSGKLHFGDIYALLIIGNLLLFILVNLMSQNSFITLYSLISALGYCLLPMLLIALVGIFTHLQNGWGILVSLALSAWCAYSATGYVQLLIRNIESDRKLLLGYPLYLYYVSFAMITIF